MARFQVVVLAFLFVNFNLTGAKRTLSGSGNSMDVVSSVPESDSLLDLDCDVDAEDQEIYGPKLQSKLCPKIIGCSFWDACRRLEDKSCPSNCRPWKEEVSQSRLLRMYTWVKRTTSGSCPRALPRPEKTPNRDVALRRPTSRCGAWTATVPGGVTPPGIVTPLHSGSKPKIYMYIYIYIGL